jgi:hypothetical protein
MPRQIYKAFLPANYELENIPLLLCEYGIVAQL